MDEKQVVVDDSQKQVVADESQKQVVPDAPQKWIVAKNGEYSGSWGSGIELLPTEIVRHDAWHGFQQPLSRQWWKRKRVLLVAALAVIVILAAVLGGVLGSRARQPTSTSLPAAASTPTASGAQSPSGLPRNIAASTYDGDSTRIYFQDDQGRIMEARNDSGADWTISDTGFVGKNGTVIATTAWRQDMSPVCPQTCILENTQLID